MPINHTNCPILPNQNLPKLMLIDASSYLYRAFHAIRQPLSTKDGFPTSAIYGVTNMLWRILKENPPEYIAAIWDPPGKNFRHDLYAEYKANRPSMPDELRQQIPYVREIIQGLGIPQFVEDGFEADDLIASIITDMKGKAEILIVSGDKDLCQLVSETVTIWEPMKDETYDREGVFNRLGVWPEQVTDYLALCGDATDNIPGIAGVGPKTASNLLAEYGSIDGLLAHLNQITKQSLREKLEKHGKDLPLWKKLVSLNIDAATQDTLEAFRRQKIDSTMLARLFNRFELERLAKQILTIDNKNNQLHKDTKNDIKPDSAQVIGHSLFSAHEKYLQIDKKTYQVAPDIIQSNDISKLLPIKQAKEIGISIAKTHGTNQERNTLCLAMPEDEKVYFISQEETSTVQCLSEVFTSTSQKIGLDIKNTLKSLIKSNNSDFSVKGRLFDLQIATYLLDKEFNEIPTLSVKKTDVTTEHFHCVNPHWCIAAKQKLNENLEKIGMKQLFEGIEMPLVPILAEMEQHGVLVDKAGLDALAIELEKQLKAMQASIFNLAGQEFNLNSPKQLGHILFDVLGLPTKKKTQKKTGFSTDNEVLTELSHTYEIASQILAYRNIAKLHSTFVQGLKAVINPTTGRIHTTFNQDITATGRLSSSEPNLQNIPVRTEEGKQIRRLFVAPTGYKLVVADYSQIELRILAHYSQDPTLLSAFMQQGDIHTLTASKVFGVSPKDVTSDMRRFAKTVNFGIVYGMSPFGLAKNIGVPQSEAKKFIENYFEQYPGVKNYINSTISQAHRQGFISTLFGRRRYLPELESSNKAIREATERMAINMPIQGTAADIIKLAMIEVNNWLKQNAHSARLILQVHDELVIEAPEENATQIASHIKTIMEGVANLRAPLVVDVGIGTNWAEAK